MKIKKNIAIASLVVLSSSNALASDEITATIGLKAWNSQMSKWIPNISSDLTPIISNDESGSVMALLPSATVRYQDFMVAGSALANKTYKFGVIGEKITRKEYDLIGGYYVLPTLAIIGGYKNVKMAFDNSAFGHQEWNFSGPIFGFSGSAPLTNGFSLYGTAAVGLLKFKPTGSLTDVTLLFPGLGVTGSYVTNSNANYRLGEIGIAYVFEGVKGLVATFGYRNQSILTEQNGEFKGPAKTVGWKGLKGRDTTEGLTVGLAFAF